MMNIAIGRYPVKHMMNIAIGRYPVKHMRNNAIGRYPVKLMRNIGIGRYLRVPPQTLLLRGLMLSPISTAGRLLEIKSRPRRSRSVVPYRWKNDPFEKL